MIARAKYVFQARWTLKIQICGPNLDSFPVVPARHDKIDKIQNTVSRPAVTTKGLEGVVALESEISLVDGMVGELVYRGYKIHDLAEHTTFKEVAYLLWNGYLPRSHDDGDDEV